MDDLARDSDHEHDRQIDARHYRIDGVGRGGVGIGRRWPQTQPFATH